MRIEIRFESTASNGYVGVLADSALVAGPIASQNAGSSNLGIYYQVGGSGLNGRFDDALGALVVPVNQMLVAAYDQRFGAGAWQADQRGSREPPLTSFYIALPRPRPAYAKVGDRLAGMVYSVGPVLDGRIRDRDVYRQIYVDAFNAVAAANRGAAEGPQGPALLGRSPAGVKELESGPSPLESIEGLRITMLSTGIYGGTSTEDEATALARDAAVLVLDALEESMRGAKAADLPRTILVNTSGADSATSKERDAFGYAAARRGLRPDTAGFALEF